MTSLCQYSWDKLLEIFPYDERWLFTLGTWVILNTTFWTLQGLLWYCFSVHALINKACVSLQSVF